MEHHEPYHWKEAIGTVVCCIAGLVLAASSGDSDNAGLLILGGLALIGVSVAAFVVTEGWQHANKLPIGKKVIAYTPVVLSGVLVFALFFVLHIAWQAFKAAMEEA